MKFDEKIKSLYEDFELYQPNYHLNAYDDEVVVTTKDATFGQTVKEGDTINVNLISDKAIQNTDKSDTARDYLVTKVSKDGNKIELEPKQPIYQTNLDTGENELVEDEKIKVDLKKDKFRLISTTEDGIWTMNKYEESKPIFKDQMEKTPVNKIPKIPTKPAKGVDKRK